MHPGYGFLSEHAGFARACAGAGLTFVGPPPDAIAVMGNKVEAKARMAEAGVPVLPGATLDPDMDNADLAGAAAQVGYPLLVKAAFGGGGRGMRIVHTPAALEQAVESARREAAAAFGDGLVFLERYVTNPRHIEVQVFADTHGSTVHLFERECSIQRRHQKVIEEAPSPAVDDALRTRLGEAGVLAARAIGYVGAGTVEFVMTPGKEFFFLEVNTRLQVEHPVTELVTGLDLVRLQLEVAAGAPLPPAALAPERRGHAVEARLYAEDVPGGFLPTSGRFHALDGSRRRGRARRRRLRGRRHRVDVLRRAARQGDRVGAGARGRDLRRCPGAACRDAPRSGHEPRAARAHARAPGVHRRRDRHGLLRAPRSRRARAIVRRRACAPRPRDRGGARLGARRPRPRAVAGRAVRVPQRG